MKTSLLQSDGANAPKLAHQISNLTGDDDSAKVHSNQQGDRVQTNNIKANPDNNRTANWISLKNAR